MKAKIESNIYRAFRLSLSQRGAERAERLSKTDVFLDEGGQLLLLFGKETIARCEKEGNILHLRLERSRAFIRRADAVLSAFSPSLMVEKTAAKALQIKAIGCSIGSYDVLEDGCISLHLDMFKIFPACRMKEDNAAV